MREKTIKIYKFEELPDDAKERAREKWRAGNDEIFFQSEIFDSFKKVFETARISIRDYSLGMDRSWIKIDLDTEIDRLHGARALGWLENNLFFRLRITRAEYLKNRRAYLSYGRAYRIGCVRPCPLTGICYDDDFLIDLVDSVRSGMTIGDSFRALADRYAAIVQSEYDDQNSAEYIADHFAANDYEFLENGDRL